MIKNGTTSANRTRWRCTTCGASSTRQRCDITNAAAFARFIEYVTTSATLKSLAGKTGLSPRSLQRRFELFWLIDVPDPRPCHMGRIYDQVFIDGTYTAGGCLLVASSLDHVIAWHWCTTESTAAYSALLDGITAPLIVVTDGGRGATSAINNCWPTTAVQRCLVHAQRVVRRHTTSRPRTNGGRAIYQLALNLTKITSLDQAAQWGVQLHQYECLYRNWLNEKTWTTDPTTKQRTWSWTHEGARRAYNSLNNLWRRNLLFTYLNPPGTTLDPQHLKSTTNSLEGGINAQLKLLARTHRGTHAEHQRRMLEWWLYLKTEQPNAPVQIAKQSNWGQNQLAKVPTLIHNENQADQETGRPALYDKAIDTAYNHSLGIRKGQL